MCVYIFACLDFIMTGSTGGWNHVGVTRLNTRCACPACKIGFRGFHGKYTREKLEIRIRPKTVVSFSCDPLRITRIT